MQLRVNYTCPACADGIYSVKAYGYTLASLWYGNENSILSGYTAITYIPLDKEGNGSFVFTGGRSVPDEATHIIAEFTDADNSKSEKISVPIPAEQKPEPFRPIVRFGVMSDMHLTETTLRRKAYRILNAMKKGSADADMLLLAGDMTNNGKPEQLELLYNIISENVACPVFSVTGNHDFPRSPITSGEMQYYDLQNKLLENSGATVESDISGAYSARIGQIEIIGLNCVTDYRKFRFPDGQIEWLQRHLDEENDALWHIILCHAPLIAHNPQRPADGHPYLNKDIKLGRIIDSHKNIIFISGHTHFSPNDYNGCVDFDEEKNNIYINDGSVCPTVSKWKNDTVVPDEWCDGVYVELTLSENVAKVVFRSPESGKRIARGYYCLKNKKI